VYEENLNKLHEINKFKQDYLKIYIRFRNWNKWIKTNDPLSTNANSILKPFKNDVNICAMKDR